MIKFLQWIRGVGVCYNRAYYCQGSRLSISTSLHWKDWEFLFDFTRTQGCWQQFIGFKLGNCRGIAGKLFSVFFLFFLWWDYNIPTEYSSLIHSVCLLPILAVTIPFPTSSVSSCTWRGLHAWQQKLIWHFRQKQASSSFQSNCPGELGCIWFFSIHPPKSDVGKTG